MKKIFSNGRRIMLVLAAFLSISILFSACKKDDDLAQTPVAGLMAFNLAPDQASVGVALGNNTFTTTPLLYTTYTGGYNSVFTGNRTVTSYSYSSGADLASTTQLFEDSSYYSLFVVGVNGKYDNVIVQDNLDSLPSGSGQAFVRYVNAIPDSTRQPTVNITSDGANIFADNTAFRSVSGFKGVAPGDVAINITGDTAINSTRNITVEDGKIYTILFLGVPQATDTAQAVQIKFVENGTIQ